jgi:tetratricopeptide (TPR) repeat protein
MLKTLINPYKVGPPVTGESFYGRITLLKRARKELIRSKVVLLQGQRRIGKTSFLKQLAISLSCHSEEQINIPIIFDIQRYIQESLPRFQLHLAEKIVKQLQSQEFKSKEIYREKLSLSINDDGKPKAPELSKLEENTSFFQDSWLPTIYEFLGNRSLVILVDEFDNLDSNSVSKSMQILIHFLGQLVSCEDQIKWVFALGKQPGKLPIEYDPIIIEGIKLPISFLTAKETRQLIEKPVEGILSYHVDAINQIYQLTSGQPHLTQALGSEIFQSVVLEQSRSNVTLEDVNSVVLNTLEVYGGAIASIIRVPPVEERVLSIVTHLTKDNSATDREEIIKVLLSKNIKISRDELTNTLNSLIEWKLIVENLKGLKISVELIRIWLDQNLPVETSPEENLNIQDALAKRRIELAEKELHLGHHESAIKDYIVALEHIPNNISALKGLAEAYRIDRNIEGRVRTLKNLYLHDSNTHNELIEALIEYAENAEKEQNFLIAAEQYEALIKLQNNNQKQWQQRLSYSLIEAFKNLIELAETKLESNLKNKSLIEKEISNLAKIESQLTIVIKAIKYQLDKNPNSKDEFADYLAGRYEERMFFVVSRIHILQSINNIDYINAAYLLSKLNQTLEMKNIQLSQNEKAAIRIIAKEIIKFPVIMFFLLFLSVIWINDSWHKYILPCLIYIFYNLPLMILFRPLSASLTFLDFVAKGISNVIHSITHFPDWIFRFPLSIVLFLTWSILLAIIAIIARVIFEEIFTIACKFFVKNIAKFQS